ncbi:MAG: GNAT family N-acetyltransferase [Anaerolineae bacterium]
MQKPIAYQQPDDVRRAQVALMHWTQQAGDCNYWHKGDIRHRLFNGGYKYQPQDIFYYWLDETDRVIGFVNLYFYRDGMFDLHVAPELRYTERHIEMFQWSEENLIASAQRLAEPLKEVVVDSMACNPRHDEFLRAQGYEHSAHVMMLTEHDLRHIPDAALPQGFRFHDATADDLENLADVHNHSFTNKWNAELYGSVFTAPLMEYEIVAVALDGRFASFTNVWVDEVNNTILFEPVGTHSDFRQMGIGKAMMVYVLERMQAELGIQRAYVCHELANKNPASAALYRSVGFRPKYEIHDYIKSLKQS